MARGYQNVFEQTLEHLAEEKPALLLHSCCAPCSSRVIEALVAHFTLTVFYYNPNIHPKSEYEKRKNEQHRLIEMLGHNIKCIDGDYEHSVFTDITGRYRDLPEGGARCDLCIALRIRETAKQAAALGLPWFCSTLSVSPHKNCIVINQSGEQAASDFGVRWLPSDFKKKNGYLRSLELSKQFSLYRQNYCGCEYSAQKEKS